jgi:hypothetical protein
MTFLRCEHYSEKDHGLNFDVYHKLTPHSGEHSMWLLRSFRFSSCVAECLKTLERKFSAERNRYSHGDFFWEPSGFDIRPAIAWGRFADQATL